MTSVKKFEIEVPDINGCIKNPMNPKDNTVGYAIESLFTLEQDILLHWNDYKIPISIKYDISEIWNDIILMIKNIEKGKKEFTIHWPSATFFAVWDFTITNNVLEIKAHWTDLNLDRADLLKLRIEDVPVIIDKNVFIEQWYKVLIPIRNVLLESHYDVKKLKNFNSSFTVLKNYAIN